MQIEPFRVLSRFHHEGPTPLAEPGRALAENPFSALLSVYANGHYPFSLGPSKVILFSFA